MQTDQAIRMSALRETRKAARQCQACGVLLPLDIGYLSCDPCRAIAAQTRYRRYHRLAQRRCCVSCGVAVEGEYVRCVTCHATNKKRIYEKRTYEKRMAQQRSAEQEA